MKRFAFHLMMLFILFFSFFLFSEEEEIMKIESSISPIRLSRGEEGKVLLKLRIKEGIVISPRPGFIIEFNPNEELIFPKNFFNASDLGIEVLENNGEEKLNFKNPIEILFAVSLGASRGAHKLEGKIRYFASSKKEGWCLKNTAKFSVPFSTRQSIVKKK